MTAAASSLHAAPSPLRIALVGNPNCGKTSLFNRLTGARQKVANYAGVTVERKEGRFTLASGRQVHVLDLPGAYSLEAASPDESITRAICLGELPGEPVPELLVCVADATNLRLHLRFVLDIRRLGRPMLLVLNMMDDARRRGIRIDTRRLALELGIPVVEAVAVRRDGVQDLLAQLDGAPPEVPSAQHEPDDVHAEVRRLIATAVVMPRDTDIRDDAIDSVLLHPVFGLVFLALTLFLMFQAVFSWAAPFMSGIQAVVTWGATALTQTMPDGVLKGLLVDGIFAGVGGVLVFLPQILILFFFILMLEESGYLPRAAFLLDHVMFRAGLTGRSFIPLLSSFACAIPGIMATRSIADPRDRFTTIMVAPLMTCSARLPVYTLLISAFIPKMTVAGLFNLQGLVLFALYAGGIMSAMTVAWIMKRLRRDETEHALLLELPSYRLPDWKSVGFGVFERGRIFLRRVGGVILALTILLWFLATFPAPPAGAVGAAINYSFAGRLGHLLAPLFAPIGFNWQIVVALIPAMAAREVVVAALGTVYAIGGSEQTVAHQLGAMIASQWTLPTAMALLAWYIFAPQCLSTLATVRRETGSWRQVGIMTSYLFALAYLAALIAYHVVGALT
ncbi:MAG TPA: ferrous iron transporter B [Moraxellaceae bacterium]|nr:ferrous iron transporter B [Moraxellaceae bacterium]